MSSPFSAILFDLDGTICDSAPGITSSLTYTFERIGVPVPSPATLLSFVGPPILDSFRSMGMDEDQVQHTLQVYREHYLAHGTLDARVYPGMPEVLRRVHEAGVPTSTATSKPETPATYILEHFGLLPYLDVVTGASDDEVRSAKADVVAEALRRLAARGVDVSRPVLVGDRHHDVEGAAAHGVPVVFAEWGYGSPAEAAGTIARAAEPLDLLPILL
ncbi:MULTISPECIES: HAD hydrolase-like protein [unclassified Curtobacterium]|uniref:HAD hydrolase-like protein n=1 Tax=unclassified Curtobacterium TaxID=257496 RepID=UPI000DAA841C|nr:MULTISPECIES: HAD hydrolase-like protein [unclassified Curtobacterium]PZE26037.1 HAD family hydrolase [Curtobacterium sp. MCBD17_028]PZE77759.1 HAD family hydrolase [Curtobacterium sp. MCBD17_019]PZF62031.1 HAD family hydrolase [Curtobacterium sp. MCBD17_034]PZM34036.1 HAD family hydrolase [Curtobacterium sp. MCBD17_031]WIB63655.1 HAD hydrolase-like protein [Curtobacterium sp. MCBD17_040]